MLPYIMAPAEPVARAPLRLQPDSAGQADRRGNHRREAAEPSVARQVDSGFGEGFVAEGIDRVPAHNATTPARLWTPSFANNRSV